MSSRFPGKISLSIKRQKRQLLDIRDELRSVRERQPDEQPDSSAASDHLTPAHHVSPQDRVSSGLSLFYFLHDPDRSDHGGADSDHLEDDQGTEVDFDGFTQDQVDRVRAEQLISYPLSDSDGGGDSEEPVVAEETATTGPQAYWAKKSIKSVGNRKLSSSPVNESKKIVSRKKRSSLITNHNSRKVTSSSSPLTLSLSSPSSSSSVLPLNATKRGSLKSVTQTPIEAGVIANDAAADLLLPDKSTLSQQANNNNNDTTSPDNHLSKHKQQQHQRRNQKRKGKANVRDDSEEDEEQEEQEGNESDASEIRKRVSGYQIPSDSLVQPEAQEAIRVGTSERKGRKGRGGGGGEKKENAKKNAAKKKKRRGASSSHQSFSLSSPSLQVTQQQLTLTATSSPVIINPSPTASADCTREVSHRKKRKKAIISQALASLQNKWKERVLSSRRGLLEPQRSGSGLAGSCAGSPAAPESPASFSGASRAPGSSVPGGILREARLQVDESTLNQIRTGTSDESDDDDDDGDDGSSDGEGESDVTTTDIGPREDGSNDEDDENLAVRDTSAVAASGRKKKKKKSPRSLKKRGSPRSEKGKHSPKKKNPGTIECVICSAIKYYSHKQRRHGVFACETCAKFFSNFMRDRKAYFCNNTGDCYINDKIQSARRCRACWLKVCLQQFDVSPADREELTQNNFLPKLKSEPHVSLISVCTSNKSELSFVLEGSGTEPSTPRRRVKQSAGESGKKRGRKRSLAASMNSAAETAEAGLLMLAPQANSGPRDSGKAVAALSRPSVRGPRVKTVCRSTATGLPRATFSPKNLNRGHVAEQEGEEDEVRSQKSCDSEDSDAIPVTDYIIMNHEREILEERRAAGLDVDTETVNETLKENNVQKRTAKKKGPKEVSSLEKPVSKNSSNKTKKRKIEQRDSPEAPVEKKKKKKKRKGDPSPPFNNGNFSKKKMKKEKNNQSGDKVTKRKSESVEPKTPSKKVVTSFASPKKKKKSPSSPKKKEASVQSTLPSSTPATPAAKQNQHHPSSQSISLPPGSNCSSSSTSQSSGALTTSTPSKKVIKKRCQKCPGCLAEDCGKCACCLDKKRAGGPGLMKQACKLRKCVQMTEPSHCRQGPVVV